MKKIASFLMASVLMICSFASCSLKKESVVGEWELKTLSDQDIKVGGIIFSENGKGSLYMDTSKILHTDGKSIIIGSGEQAVEFNESLIEYDGKNLNLAVNGQDIASLEKSEGDGNTDSYDGKYLVKSGVMHDTILGNLKEIEDKDAVSVYIDLEGSSSTVTFADIFDYKTKNGKMEMTGYAYIFGDTEEGKPVTVDYKIKDDIMTVTSESGEPEELKRIK